MDQIGLSTSRWLDAIWEPNTQLHTLPNGIDMLDLVGDGDAKLIVIDLGNRIMNNVKLKIFKGPDQTTELAMVNIPCAVIGFYMENDENKSAAVAVGICSSIFIFKNLKPHFKFCLPQLTTYLKEQDIWSKTNKNNRLNLLTLFHNLKLLLMEIGISYISPRTLKFLSLKKEYQKNFVEEFKKFPLLKINIVTIISIIRKDSWSEIASSYLIVGTEFGEIYILDHRAFSVIEKYIIGWPPIAITSSGLWIGEGQIVLIGREGKIGAVKRGDTFKPWESLSAPAVAVTLLTSEEIAVVTMNGLFFAYSKQGIKLWKVQLPGNPLDMVNLPVPQSGLSLLAISIVRFGVRIYNQKHHVDTIKPMESISSLKYGRLGQEQRTLVMITCSGGFNVKILKRTAQFHKHLFLQTNLNLRNNINKFVMPKKNKLFIEQTIRERSETIKIHRIFQQGFLRLRLSIATRIKKRQIIQYKFELAPISVQYSIFGLGPNYIIKIYITSVLENFATNKIFLVLRSNNILMKQRIINLPYLTTGIRVPIIIFLNTMKNSVVNKIQILFCYKGQVKPLNVVNITIPVAEEEIEI